MLRTLSRCTPRRRRGRARWPWFSPPYRADPGREIHRVLDDVAALLDLVGVEVGLSQEGQVQRLVPAMRVLVRAQSLLKDGDGPQRTSQHSPAATGHDPYFDLVHPVC